MEEKVFLFLNLLENGSLVFLSVIISVLGINIAFMLNLFCSIFCQKHDTKKRILTLFIGLVFSVFPAVIIKENGLRVGLVFALVSTLLNLVVFFIRTKTKKDIILPLEKPIERYIPLAEKIREVEKLEVKKQEEKAPVKTKADFSHVKNVIERLNAFPLSVGDKKQVKELEDAIILIENGAEEDYEINDGLGALLKIMAKYGV